jgi:hypothetical protein
VRGCINRCHAAADALNGVSCGRCARHSREPSDHTLTRDIRSSLGEIRAVLPSQQVVHDCHHGGAGVAGVAEGAKDGVHRLRQAAVDDEINDLEGGVDGDG